MREGLKRRAFERAITGQAQVEEGGQEGGREGRGSQAGQGKSR